MSAALRAMRLGMMANFESKISPKTLAANSQKPENL